MCYLLCRIKVPLYVPTLSITIAHTYLQAYMCKMSKKANWVFCFVLEPLGRLFTEKS